MYQHRPVFQQIAIIGFLLFQLKNALTRALQYFLLNWWWRILTYAYTAPLPGIPVIMGRYPSRKRQFQFYLKIQHLPYNALLLACPVEPSVLERSNAVCHRPRTVIYCIVKYQKHKQHATNQNKNNIQFTTSNLFESNAHIQRLHWMAPKQNSKEDGFEGKY